MKYRLITDGKYCELNPKCPRAGAVLDWHSDVSDIGVNLIVSTDIITKGTLYYSNSEVEPFYETMQNAS